MHTAFVSRLVLICRPFMAVSVHSTYQEGSGETLIGLKKSRSHHRPKFSSGKHVGFKDGFED